jgi:hypothetical protein
MVRRPTPWHLLAAAAHAILLVGSRWCWANEYEVRVVAGKPTEQRCFHDGRHFLTIVSDNGTLAIRPHPGLDPNGWGTSLYPQPFLPGAVLGHTAATRVVVTGHGIRLTASGSVSRNADGTYGTWNAELDFQYHPARKRLDGTGKYVIALDGPLAGVGDLNLLKIASNYLKNVPLRTGGVGDTGDMQEVHFAGDAFKATWRPPSRPAFCPQERFRELSIAVQGRFNGVDAARQGHKPIASAYKPSLCVTLRLLPPEAILSFAAMYDVTKARDFWEDNVSVTPLVSRRSPLRRFNFTMSISSEALPGDGGPLEAAKGG